MSDAVKVLREWQERHSFAGPFVIPHYEDFARMVEGMEMDAHTIEALQAENARITKDAARIEELERERDGLKAAKWDVKHTDTINEIVQMGMALDEAIKHAEALQAENAKLRLLLIEAIEMTGEPFCWHDHHGYCQAHNLQPLGECWVERARALTALQETKT